MDRVDELIDIITKDMENYDVQKIFWNDDIGKVIVMTKPVTGVDGMFMYENTLENRKLFTPNEDFNIYHEIVNDDNLVYEKGEQ